MRAYLEDYLRKRRAIQLGSYSEARWRSPAGALSAQIA